MSLDYNGNPIDPLDDLNDGGPLASNETAQEMEEAYLQDHYSDDDEEGVDYEEGCDLRAEASEAIDHHERFAPDAHLDSDFEDRISGFDMGGEG